MSVGAILPGDLAWIFGTPLLVAVILVLVAGRGDADSAKVRTEARYLGAILLISLFVTLFAVFGVARGLTGLLVDRSADRWFGYTPLTSTPISCLPEWPERFPDGCRAYVADGDIWAVAVETNMDLGLDGAGYVPTAEGGYAELSFASSDNDDYRLVIGSALLALAAGAVFVFHRRHARKLEAKRGFRAGVGGRVERAFVLGVCFVAALIVIVGATRGLYGLFRIMVPGVTGEGAHDIERKLGIAQFLSYLVLVSGALWIFFIAWPSSARGD